MMPVNLGAGKSKKLTIELASDAFSRRDGLGDLYELKGTHIVHVGFNQPDKRSVELSGVETVGVEVEI